MKSLLALDVGTTAVKVGLFSADLAPICLVIEEYTLDTPENDIVELDPRVYWESACKGIREAFAKSGANSGDVVSITCTTQGETMIPVDGEGTPLHKAIVWLDARAKEEAAFIGERFAPEAFYKKTGLPEVSPYCPVAKLMWLKNQRPDIYERTHKILLLEDYLVYRLTGKYVSNPALQCSTGYFDIVKETLWEEIFDCCGLDRGKIPEIYPCGVTVGKVLPEVASALGFNAETVVSTGAMDQVAAAVGCGNIRENVITDTVGTCQVVCATADAGLLERWTPVTLYNHAVSGKYLLLTLNQTAGMVLKWFRNEFCNDFMERYGADAFDKMGELAAAEPPLSRGLALFPHLTGIQGAVNDADARGAFIGIGLDTNRGCFIRAIMEGVSYMSKDSMRLMQLAPESIISLGGGAKSPLWNQIKADVCNMRVKTLPFEEAALMGAAILGGVASGVFASLEAACTMVHTGSVFEPDPDAVKVYEAGFERYLKMYECLSPLFGRA